MDPPSQSHRSTLKVDFERAWGLRQHRPVEVAFIGDGEHAVPHGNGLQRVFRPFLPFERRDFTRDDVDQHRILNACVLDGQAGGERRKDVARQAVRREPVGDDGFPGARPEAVGQELSL